MELQEIEVVVDENGAVKIEVHGVKGMKCLDLTADLEEALGGEIDSREMKPDAYATVQEEVRDQERLHGGT
jgi:hypothetical protein